MDYLAGKSFGGRINIIYDEQGPVVLEKIGLGESHSGITLRETLLQGVRLPEGSLVIVDYPDSAPLRMMKTSNGEETVESSMPLSSCTGFRFLRLTTLAVSPKERLQAFGAHLRFQKINAMPWFDRVTIEDLSMKARQALDAIRRVMDEQGDSGDVIP